jgi:hypothetical protein
VKTTIIALSAAALVAAAPAVLAQGVPGKTPALQHKVSRKHHPGVFGYAPLRETQARGSKKGYRGAFGYAPEPRGLDRDIDASRQAGGGGGGGGGGM